MMKLLNKGKIKRSRLDLCLESNNSILQSLNLIDLKDIHKKMILSHILKKRKEKAQNKEKEGQNHMEDLILHPCLKIGSRMGQVTKLGVMNNGGNKDFKIQVLLHLDGKSKIIRGKIIIRKIKSFALLFSSLLLFLLYLGSVLENVQEDAKRTEKKD